MTANEVKGVPPNLGQQADETPAKLIRRLAGAAMAQGYSFTDGDIFDDIEDTWILIHNPPPSYNPYPQ